MTRFQELYRSIVLGLVLSSSTMIGQGLIENVVVEEYYISEEQDLATTVGGSLAAGSVSYRIFVDLADGCELRSIYGDANHPFSISTTTLFFNNDDRGETWGFDIPDNRLDENTVALDSWLSLGAATDEHWGVQKALDTDGSIVGGSNHEDGLLNNQSLDFPLTEADGLQQTESTDLENFFRSGDDPGLVFSDSTYSGEFTTVNFKAQNIGIELPDLGNDFLIAQLTTNGELSFTLNLEIIDPEGQVKKYVSSNDMLLANEVYSPLLAYPPQCGCTDPNYLEFNPSALCDDGSCETIIVFGCNDPEACNYDPEVNLNIPELCCILPDNCEGLDPELICPGVVSIETFEKQDYTFDIYPNPAQEKLVITLTSYSAHTVRIFLTDQLGRLLISKDVIVATGENSFMVELEFLERGTYFITLLSEHGKKTKSLIKK